VKDAKAERNELNLEEEASKIRAKVLHLEKGK